MRITPARARRRATLSAAVAACALAGGVLATAAAPASAATPRETEYGPHEVGFIAPVKGQSVSFLSRGAAGGAWSEYCFRWPGGVNTGKGATASTGLEAWNDYSQSWEGAGVWAQPWNAWEAKATLHSDGKCGAGTKISNEKVAPRPRPIATFWFDFR